MRIAYVIPRLHKHGGTEIGIAMLVEDLWQQHQVSVVSHSLEEVDAEGVRFYRAPMLAKPATARYLTFLAANALLMPGRASRSTFDIVHAAGADSVHANVATAQFCQAERLRLVRTGVIRLPTSTSEQRARKVEALVFGAITSFAERTIYRSRELNRIIAVSAGVKRDLLHHYRLDPEKVVVIPNAVDGDRFSPSHRSTYRAAVRSSWGITETHTVLLFVAHEWERKGLPLVLQALSLVPDVVRRKVLLAVVGRGNRAYYEAIGHRLGLDGCVAFAGDVGDVRPYYAAADLLVFPSYYEAFSLVTLEAAASGLPLVVTRINGAEELVEEGRNGFFVRHDAADIAARLVQLIEDPALRDEMGARARESVARYSRRQVADDTLAVYEQVLAT